MRPFLAAAMVVVSVAGGVALTAACKAKEPSEAAPLKVGFFPNLTHGQALVGRLDGTFTRALGEGRIEMVPFNAGPSAMEALIAGSLDASYVGPGPAINTYLKAGKELRVIAGAASGGAVFITRTATKPEHLKGKRLATPQLGNTQDIALRHWLKRNGLTVKEGGKGDVEVTSITNAEVLALFQRGQLEGAWVPEPWGARLIAEGGGKLFLDERSLWPDGQFPTTLLVTTRKVIEKQPEKLRALLKAHLDLTQRWRSDPEAFREAVNKSFGAITGKPVGEKVLTDAFSRLEPSLDPERAVLAETAHHALELGYLKTEDIAGMVDTTLLDALSPPRAARR
jgi:NitT/TauT family transport system substrate-binding protein